MCTWQILYKLMSYSQPSICVIIKKIVNDIKLSQGFRIRKNWLSEVMLSFRNLGSPGHHHVKLKK